MAFRRSSRVSPSVSDAAEASSHRPDASKDHMETICPLAMVDVATLLTINTEGNAGESLGRL